MMGILIIAVLLLFIVALVLLVMRMEAMDERD